MAETLIEITNTVSILESDLEETFIRAAGPGGQNVNKVATAVQLRFSLTGTGLPERVMTRARKLAGSRLTKDDEIVIQANRFRTQERNREDARQRLVKLLQDAAKPPPPKRKPTKPSKAARAKRMDSKTKRGNVKKLRGRVSRED